jgi:DNA-binding NtrC family response regulator
MQRQNNLKFFIVDDDPFYRFLYQQHLSNLGFKDNVLFDNGEDCINRLDLQPDIIFIDYNMERSNGLEVIQKIRMTHPNIYLLLISGQKDLKVAVDALKSGAYDYIVKGEEDLNMISGAINKILSRKVPIAKLYEMN